MTTVKKCNTCKIRKEIEKSTGYNGAARGMTNCCDVGECWREANNIPHGTQYEACVAVHAEQNAIISASRQEMLGSTLYLAGFENGEKMT